MFLIASMIETSRAGKYADDIGQLGGEQEHSQNTSRAASRDEALDAWMRP
jgi:hypothetical protein